MSTAVGQTWTKIGSLDSAFYCAYFWDAHHGVVGGKHILYTYDWGTWKKSVCPEMPGEVRELRLLKPGKLYAAQGGDSAIWVSSDSGRSWQTTGLTSHYAQDVYFSSDGVLRVSAGGINPQYPNYVWGGGTFARLDSRICMLTDDDGGPPYYSNDGGITWSRSTIKPGNFTPYGGYGCYADTCKKIFYYRDEYAQEMQSLDSGQSWLVVSALKDASTWDILEGKDGVLFTQFTPGVLKSLDGGVTWENIGGPGNMDDAHMFPFGPYGQDIIAGTYTGEVWMCTPGGPGNRSNGDPDTLRIDRCERGRAAVQLDISSYQSGLPTKIYAHILDDSLHLLSVEGGDTLIAQATPVGTYIDIAPGPFDTSTYHMDFTILDGCPITFNRTLTVIEKRPSVSAQITGRTVSACDSTRIPCTFKLGLCDSLSVDSIAILPPSNGFLSFDSSYHRFISRSSDTIWFKYDSKGLADNSPYVIRIHGHFLIGNVVFDTLIHLSMSSLVKGRPHVTLPSSFTLRECDSGQATMILTGAPCESIDFDSMQFVDSLGLATLDSSSSMTLVSGASRSFSISINPHRHPAKETFRLHIHGKSQTTSEVFDTTVAVVITSTAVRANLSPDTLAFDLGEVQGCHTKDTVLNLVNHGCDTIWVLKNLSNLAKDWTVVEPVFPLILPPDSSFSSVVRFTPGSTGLTRASILYQIQQPSSQPNASDTVVVFATGIESPPRLIIIPSSIFVKDFSLCVRDTVLEISLTNPDCDTVHIFNVALQADEGFTLSNASDITLPPDSTHTFIIQFVSSHKGVLDGVLKFRSMHTGSGQLILDSSIGITVFVNGGDPVASVSTGTIDFGLGSVCSDTALILSISNSGCDTLRVSQGDFSSSQFRFSDTIHFPVIVPPNNIASLQILTHLDTTNHPTALLDSVQFASNSKVPIPPIVLTRSIIYPGHFSLAMSSEDSARVSASVPVYVLRRGTIPKETDSVGFDLVYDEDVLAFTSAIEKDIRMTGARLLVTGLMDRSFAMKPATDRDTIATLLFTSFLTKDDRTSLTLSGQKFYAGGALSPPCVASIDTGSSSGNFTLELVCGDGAIQNALADLPIDLTSLEVSNQSLAFTLRRNSTAVQLCTAEILNVMGQSVAKRKIELTPGNNPVAIDVGQLPSGSYFLRLASGSAVMSRAFSVVR